MKRRGRFTPAEAFEILEPIMSVLNTAHAMGVVHRDLKPENIMIGKAGTGGEPVLKLLDLGIAKMREIAGGEAAVPPRSRWPDRFWVRPITCRPSNGASCLAMADSEIDGRADIYSLGLVFYEMIVGRRPYSGMTLHELRREHVSVMPPPLHEIVPDVPRAFSEAIARATAKDRGDRQRTAGEFAAELRAAIGPTKASDVWAGTIADFPQADTVLTEDLSRPLKTKTEVAAPTITDHSPATVPAFRSPVPGALTPEQAPTSQPRAPAVVAQRDASGISPAGASMDMASSATILQPPKLHAPAPPSRRGAFMVAIAGVLTVLLIVVAVGGFFAFKWMTAKSNENPAETAPDKGKTSSSGPANGTAPIDIGQYWLELYQESVGEPARVAGVVPLASGQPFKFHFVFSEDGYLYIVGPGAQNQPTAFLTAKPAPVSGLTSNQVTKGADFSFPTGETRGEINWLALDKKPGTEEYTIIFSPRSLSSPHFLQEPAGRQLSIAERGDLASFVEQHRSNQAITELDDALPTQQFVAVKVPASGQSGNPITFVIRIEHK